MATQQKSEFEVKKLNVKKIKVKVTRHREGASGGDCVAYSSPLPFGFIPTERSDFATR